MKVGEPPLKLTADQPFICCYMVTPPDVKFCPSSHLIAKPPFTPHYDRALSQQGNYKKYLHHLANDSHLYMS